MRNNILVTGSHRSGSTWVGSVIGRATKVRYYHEPFNLSLDHKNSPIKVWFECFENTTISRQKEVINYLAHFHSVKNAFKFRKLLTIKSVKDLHSYLNEIKVFLTFRALFKDPIALLSAAWIYQKLHWNVIVIIRHPAAFVASLKVKNWEFDFNNLLVQTNLMNSSLKQYRNEIEEYTQHKKDIIHQGILIWNILHSVILRYSKTFKNVWYFVRHEDLSKRPIEEFNKMFSFLRLPFEEHVKEYIIESTSSEKNNDLQRNSMENILSWKNRLTQEEIELIKEDTKDVWRNFYTEEDW